MMSEKGKQQSLPLVSKSFYIDETDVPPAKLRRLERSISLLGAKLEKFFTKEISYLVTDHGQPADYKSRSHSAEASTPSPFTYTPGNSVGTPPETSNSNPKANISRASKMVNISQKQSSRNNSLSAASVSQQLVGNAKLWSIKLLQPDVALRWMEKKAVSLGLHKRRNSSCERPARAATSKAKILKAPFIKIEDQSGQYRPIYRQLAAAEVPVLDSKAMFCPFESRVPQAIATGSQHVDLSEPGGDETHDSSKLDVSRAGEKLSTSKSPAKGGITKAKRKLLNSNVQVKKKLTFCMVCKVRYEDLDQHLRSDQHLEFTSNNNNYTEIDNLINSSASMQRFLDDIIKYHNIHKMEGLAQEKSLEVEVSAAAESGAAEAMETGALPPEILHRSVSDSEDSSPPHDSTAENIDAEATALESKVICKDEKQCLEIPDSPTTTPAESQPAMPPPTLPHTSHAANTDILSATPAAAVVSPMLLHTLPNMSRVDTKPKLCNLPCPDSNDSASITSPELLISKTHTGKTRISKGIGEQIANKLSKVLDKIGKGRVSPPAGDSVTAAKSISDSEMSPSEIVKLRKRGKKKSTTPKKLKSPLKPSPHVKHKVEKTALGDMADMKAHWVLLTENNSQSEDCTFGLPLDVSYGVLSDTQLQNMTQQKADLGDVKDDISLVESIHEYLQANANNNSNVDVEDNHLLSCDEFLNQRIAHHSSQTNSMAAPVTPKKSPRRSLGARDWPDEQFSPHKKKFSLSMEKEKRHRTLKEVTRIPAFNLDLPNSASVLSSKNEEVPADNKENSPNVSTDDALTVLELEEKDDSVFTNSAVQEDMPTHNPSPCKSVAHDGFTSNTADRMSSPRQIISTPDMRKKLEPLHVSTPAERGTTPNPSASLASPEACSQSTKLSLLGSPREGEISPGLADKSSYNKRSLSVQFSRDGLFGFDETAQNDTPFTKTPKTNLKKYIGTPGSRDKRKRKRPTKRDYERQSSLLSFGSSSHSICDDVFSLPPDSCLPNAKPNSSENLPASGVTIKKRSRRPSSPEEKYSLMSDSDLKAPGFKCNSRTRKQAEKQRRLCHAGSTPGRKRSKHTTISSTISSGSPENSPSKKLRLYSECMTSPRQLQDPHKGRQRTPSVAKQKEFEEINQRHISSCETPNSVDEAEVDAQSPVKLRTSPRKPKTLTSPARNYLYKHKYCYKVSTQC